MGWALTGVPVTRAGGLCIFCCRPAYAAFIASSEGCGALAIGVVIFGGVTIIVGACVLAVSCTLAENRRGLPENCEAIAAATSERMPCGKLALSDTGVACAPSA